MTNKATDLRGLTNEIVGGEDNVQPAIAETLRQRIMVTNGFCYTATRTVPQCNNRQSRGIKMQLTTNIYIFWEATKLVAQKLKALFFNINKK